MCACETTEEETVLVVFKDKAARERESKWKWLLVWGKYEDGIGIVGWRV